MEIIYTITRLDRMNAISDLINNTKGSQKSLRCFAEELSQPFKDADIDISIGHQTIYHWGIRKHLPNPVIFQVLVYIADKDLWQYEFAKGILAILK